MYIDGLLARLGRSDIEPKRRAHIVAMLHIALHELLGQWKSCIRRVGSKRNLLPPGIDVRPGPQQVAMLYLRQLLNNSRPFVPETQMVLLRNFRRISETGSSLREQTLSFDSLIYRCLSLWHAQKLRTFSQIWYKPPLHCP
jgi:hypothetical protein